MRCILLQMRYNVVSTVVMILLYRRPRNFIFARCAAAPGPERIFRCLIAAVGRAAHMRVYTYTHVNVVSSGTETPKNRFADSGWSMGFSVTHYPTLLYNIIPSCRCIHIRHLFEVVLVVYSVFEKKNDSV